MSRTKGQKEQSLKASVSIFTGILALATLSIGLTRAGGSEPQEEPVARVAGTTAEAENISNIDTVIVYDKSGSMEFDTLCYGCWEPVAGQMYPDGNLYPLHWSDSTIASADHCAGWSEASGYNCGSYQVYDSYYERNDCNYHHLSHDDRYYTVIEAEEYSFLNVSATDWGYAPYYTFWVVQRNEYNDSQSDDVGAEGRDARGAYLGHHPYRNYQYSTGLGVACTWSDLTSGGLCRSGIPVPPNPAPRADYDFYAPSDDESGVRDDYYVWIRGQGGPYSADRHIFWGIDGSPRGQENYFPQGPYYDGADEDLWDWRCLGRVDNLYQGTHTLNLWAGGAGFNVDRIVIQTYDDGSCNNDSSPPDSPDTYPANNGRTNWACHPCDPRFAGRPGGQTSPSYRPDCNIGSNPDQRENVIYDDEQPIRNALEAAKYFVGRLDPHFDQVGYVPYSNNAEIASELQCLERLGGGGCTPQVITDTVIYELDSTSAGGNTNIAAGMMNGIAVLSTDAGHYGRPEAAHVMVLMTEGEANIYDGCDPACDDEDLWPDGEAAKDCVIYYAQQARDNGILIYTISLGWGADIELMREVAEITGGDWFVARPATRANLDKIFEELLTREASFAASPTSGAAPLTATFSNTSTGTYVANLWTFGDGATSTEISPTHTYTIPGVYTITLAVAGPGGVDTLTRTSYITVQQPPVQPDFAPSYKAVSPKYANYDERITYTVAIQNATGPLTNIIHFTDTIPDGLSYIAGTMTATHGIITDTAVPTLRWIGALSPTPAVTITYAATVITTENKLITNVAEFLMEPGHWGDPPIPTYHVRSTKVYVNWQRVFLPLVLRDYTSPAN